MDNTTITVANPNATYSVTASGDLICTDYIRHCVELAKAQGYLFANIVEALETVNDELQEEMNLYPTL